MDVESAGRLFGNAISIIAVYFFGRWLAKKIERRSKENE